MIESKILGKSYKTKATYKVQINKYEKLIKEDYADVKSCQKRGWKTYLGESIVMRLVDFKSELRRIDFEKKRILD